MECSGQLDAARHSAAPEVTMASWLRRLKPRRLKPGPLKQRTFSSFRHKVVALLIAGSTACACAQSDPKDTTKQLFEQERWEQLAAQASASSFTSAELDYEYGVALAHLGRLAQAQAVLRAGARLAPHDKRFPIELAGVAFKLEKQDQAIHYLRHALRLDPKDSYANEFLATIYFLQGNLEAAVRYWNRVEKLKPQIQAVRSEPLPRLSTALLDHAFAFAPATTLKLEELRASKARVQSLEVFPNYRFDLMANPDGTFDISFQGQEANGWGATRMEGLLRTFRGLPFQEVTPEYFNLRRSAINFISLVRWDPDKRRLFAAVSSPLAQDPRWRFRLGVDLRDENWDVFNSLGGPAQLLAALNLRRQAITTEISRLVGARWKWALGVELSHRDYRNVLAGTALGADMLAQGDQLKQTARLEYYLWRSPERRFTVSGNSSLQSGRLWSKIPESFEKLQSSVDAHWFPRSRSDDFETGWQLRAGRTFGPLPFDELYMLGLERDNDLLMRAHTGTRDGRKGNAPLGSNYLVFNWEIEKNIWSNGFVRLRFGPFVDTGKIEGFSSALGPHKWLLDTGGQLTVQVLGVSAIFSFGLDLRTGTHAFYTRVGR
jgi:tetratricopeptide (TPR) repeat protein